MLLRKHVASSSVAGAAFDFARRWYLADVLEHPVRPIDSHNVNDRRNLLGCLAILFLAIASGFPSLFANSHGAAKYR